MTAWRRKEGQRTPARPPANRTSPSTCRPRSTGAWKPSGFDVCADAVGSTAQPSFIDESTHPSTVASRRCHALVEVTHTSQARQRCDSPCSTPLRPTSEPWPHPPRLHATEGTVPLRLASSQQKSLADKQQRHDYITTSLLRLQHSTYSHRAQQDDDPAQTRRGEKARENTETCSRLPH